MAKILKYLYYSLVIIINNIFIFFYACFFYIIINISKYLLKYSFGKRKHYYLISLWLLFDYSFLCKNILTLDN